MIFQILFLLINFITLSLCDSDFDYTRCNNTFKCGNKDLGYPFWGGERPSSCGHPKLGLTCVDENTSLKMNNVTYRVIQVYEGYDYLQLARDDYLEGICQPKYANTTIDHDLFQLDPSYANFVLSYGCPSKNCTNEEQFHCTAADGECRDVLVYQGSKKILGGCESGSVIVPLHNDTITQDIQSVNKVLHNGFVVRTKVNNTACVQCQRSFGFCAYGNSLDEPICYCSNQRLLSPGTNCSTPFMNPAGSPKNSKSSSKQIKLALVIPVPAAGMVALVIFVICVLRKFFTNHKLVDRKADDRIEEFIIKCGSLSPKRYTYAKIMRITKFFEEKLGEGGYGSVYKGKLPCGQLVAVKLLHESKKNGKGEEFINEVASISRTSHINVVTLLGFCYQKTKRALIYEYMPNGSLDKYICDSESSTNLDWKTLCQVALGLRED